MPSRFAMHVTQPLQLVSAVLRAFAGTASLSLEGDLSQANLQGMGYDWGHPTAVLPRHTSWPIQDFVIIPLTRDAADLLIQRVLPQIGLRTRVLHLVMACNEQVVFAAYDQFAPECVWIDASIGEPFLIERLREGSIKDYCLITDG